MVKFWKLYILRCRDGSLYTGITDDVERRLVAHRAGKGAKYTRGRGPLELVYQEFCGSHSHALRRELEIKSLIKTQKIALCEAYQHGGNIMTYDEVRAAAKGHMGPCHVCPVCDGRGCGNQIPGPGSKGSGKVATRNYQAWQDIYLNMDTIAPDEAPDTSMTLFGQKFDYPIFAAPIGAVQNHFGKEINEEDYADMLVKGCLEAGIAAFTGDGLADFLFAAGCSAMGRFGFAIPTVKPWNRELVFKKIDLAKKNGAKMMAMDIDASGLPFLKNTNPPSGSKSVEELKEIIDYAGVPFILKGIMTPAAAEKALAAGASGIIVSNHGGRVLDQTPASAWVLPKIAEVVNGRMTVLVDGGIRTGIDVFKAIALGADGVLIGRPFVTSVYGGKEAGVKAYVDKLGAELRDAMQMCGPRTLAEISRENLWEG